MRLRLEVVALSGAPVPPDAGTGGAITVVMNVGSGSTDKDSARAAIEDGFRGCDCALRIARRPQDVVALAAAAAAERPGLLVAAGGDGTMNAVAGVARAAGLPFGAIALGTFNYFARELGMPADPGTAARAIAGGVLRRVPVGEMDGRLFLNNASIGLYRRLVERREQDKQRFGRSRLVAIASGLATLLREHRPYRLRLDVDGRESVLSTPGVFFGRNALQLARLGLDEALCVARGELAVLALREVGRRELLGLALRGAIARLETAENLQQRCAASVEVDFVGRGPRRLRVAIDGELADCRLPLRVRVVPDALAVVVPRPWEPPP